MSTANPPITTRLWRWIGHNKEQLGLCFAVLAAATALYQYMESVSDGRKKETLKYVEWYQQERVGQARQVLFTNTGKLDYARAANAASSVPPDMLPLEEFIAPTEKELLTLVEHYMNLAACVKAQICDESLACYFYKDDIVALNNSYRQVFEITWQKRTGRNPMSGPVRLAGRCP